MNSKYSTHHTWWERRSYRTPLQKLIRGLGTVTIQDTIHRDIHALLLPPPMPTASELAGLGMYCDGKKSLARLELSCYYFDGLAKKYELGGHEAHYHRAVGTASHLLRQLEIIQNNQPILCQEN